MQHMMHRLDDVALTTTWLQYKLDAHAAHPRRFRKHVRYFVSHAYHPRRQDRQTDKQTNKAVAPSTAFGPASNQSCNGRDGEKLER